LCMVREEVRYTKARMEMYHIEARLSVYTNEREIGTKGPVEQHEPVLCNITRQTDITGKKCAETKLSIPTYPDTYLLFPRPKRLQLYRPFHTFHSRNIHKPPLLPLTPIHPIHILQPHNLRLINPLPHKPQRRDIKANQILIAHKTLPQLRPHTL
jgi:hypothetical protein